MNSLVKLAAGFGILGIIVLALVLVIGGPLLTILALNTLFGTGIKFGIGTYFAMLWLHVLLNSVKSSSNK